MQSGPTTDSTPNGRNHLPQLDALRGVACLTVLVAHLKAIPFLRWVPDEVGVAGVGLFFVLSGFLITRILLADRAANRGFFEFYNRRAARILPIYFLTLGILAVLWPGKELLWAATFSFNFQFLAGSRDYFQSASTGSGMPPIAHFWSLCVEEHYYWVWPALVMLLPRKALVAIPCLVAVATPGLTYALGSYLTTAGFSQVETDGLLSRLTVTQLVGISLGSLAALYESWLHEPPKSFAACCAIGRSTIVGLVLLLAGALWIGFSPRLPESITRAASSTSLHVLCGGAFLLALHSRLLKSLKPLSFAGRYSYGLYLYHLPIYAACGLIDGGEARPAMGLLALALTGLAAGVSYHGFELPILSHIRSWETPRHAPPATWRLAFGATVSVLLLAGCLVTLGSAYTLPTLATNAGPKNSTSDRDDLAHAEPLKAIASERIETIVVGSSHGELGFAAPECRGVAYNLAFESQDLWYDCQIVEAMLDRLPNLKRVVFCVSVFSFRYSISDTDSERWREALYFHACGLRARLDKGERKYSSLVLSRSRPKMDELRAKWHFADEPLQGWRPRQEVSLSEESGKAAAARHQKHSDRRIAENQALLTATIQACQRRGIECLLVSIPTHASYRDHLAPDYRTETKHLLEQTVAQTSVALLDYSDDARFAASDFYDSDHLNESGARKFVQQFEADDAARIARGASPRDDQQR